MDSVLPVIPPYAIELPREQTAPLVFASPHSGASYPPQFLADSLLDPQNLRRSEDSYVDELFGAAPDLGVPLLRALFPRAYLDPNREPWELDPSMFDSPLPHYVNTTSPRVAAGLGTIARIVGGGAEIYRRKLSFTEARERILALHQPYHEALGRLVDETARRFGGCLLVDCHSMPSIAESNDNDLGMARVDIVLGDCHGHSCDRRITDEAEDCLVRLGYRVVRNAPYAGGYTTQHYGRPGRGQHALQIEVNRHLYLDEVARTKLPGFGLLRENLGRLIQSLMALPWTELAA